MKRMLVGIAVAASLIATGALAADLPAKGPAYTKAPAYVAPVYEWTGFYIGGNIGYSWGRSSDASTVTNGAGTVLFTSANTTDLNGIVGGGQIGYNWQMQNWLFGLEADIQATDEKGTRNFTCPQSTCTPTFGQIAVFPGPSVPVALSQKIDWFGTVRGRLGILVTPQVLLYATGGLAYGEVDSSAVIGAAGTAFSTVSNTHVGWTVGAGIEGMIAPNWTARLEYLYIDLGTANGSFATTIGALGGGSVIEKFSSHVTDNILRVGINYKFGGPVMAKY